MVSELRCLLIIVAILVYSFVPSSRIATAQPELPSRLDIGMYITVESGRVAAYRDPSFRSEEVIRLYWRMLAVVIDGPYENDGTLWWLAFFPEGTTGYIAEMDSGRYLIRPATLIDASPDLAEIIDSSIEAGGQGIDLLKLVTELVANAGKVSPLQLLCGTIDLETLMMRLDEDPDPDTQTAGQWAKDLCTLIGLLIRDPVTIGIEMDQVFGLSERVLWGIVKHGDTSHTLTCDLFYSHMCEHVVPDNGDSDSTIPSLPFATQTAISDAVSVLFTQTAVAAEATSIATTATQEYAAANPTPTPRPDPEQDPVYVAEQWSYAIGTLDVATAGNHTCEAYSTDVRDSLMTAKLLLGAFSLGTLGYGEELIDWSDVEFTLVQQTSTTAVVHVEGRYVPIVGDADYMNDNLNMVYENGRWKICQSADEYGD